MPSILSKALSLLTGSETKVNTDWLKMPKNRPFKTLTERELINLEAEIGAQLFGPVPKGRRREFFCLDAKTWLWHEEWFDDKKKLQSLTTRYEIQAEKILKVQDGARYSYVTGDELINLLTAINMYYERVMREIYQVDPDTGVRLSA